MTSYKVQSKYQEVKNNNSRKQTCNNNRCYRHAFNIKTKCCRYKCEKALKKKLRTYKLRPEGEEDPEVVDVSHILLTSLKIKSPTRQLKSSPVLGDSNCFQPTNYLFKMARRKHKIKSNSTEDVSDKNKLTHMFLKTNSNSSQKLNEKSPVNNSDSYLSCESQDLPATESQEIKQTNAFKLMMDSRNKSIGCNSPGKEKNVDPSEIEEIIEKKTIKAKRNLALQKLAEAKGASKNKEIEKFQEKCIEIKMKKRAERLKKLISNAKNKQKSNKNQEEKINRTEKNSQKINRTEKNSPTKKNITQKNKKVVETIEIFSDSSEKSIDDKHHNDAEKKVRTLNLVDIFEDVLKPKKSPVKKLIPKEDEEFIKKLSPSVKKKENMLCYFQKIEKIIDTSLEAEDISEQSPIIKVKVFNKDKKKMKKKKLSLNKELNTEVLKDHNDNSSCNNDVELTKTNDNHTEKETAKERKTRRRKENSDISKQENVDLVDSLESKDGRPRRNVKRPIKYVDDVQLSSSDDELCIFTPRKKIHVENKKEPKDLKILDKVVVSDDDSREKTTKPKKIEKKATKLAPIFVPKPLLNPEQLEAKQKFLYSGVPDEIKKIQSQHQNFTTEFRNEFPLVVHVQQYIEKVTETPNLLILSQESSDDELPLEYSRNLFKELVANTQTETTCNLDQMKNNPTTILHNIKELYPKFPVYRTFRLLKSKSKRELKELTITDLDNSTELMNSIIDASNENPDYLSWTDKYKATSTKQMIGNFEAIKEMRKWLTSWTENDFRSRNTQTTDSDSSDFCYDSDSNSRDYIKSMNNLLILIGPPGCGKTSSVYAVAAELAIKVIEVNASSKRTGKMMLQDLQEATQSHKVNRAGIDNSQKMQEVIEIPELKTYRRRGRPKKIETSLKKSDSKDSIKASQVYQPLGSQDIMSLILVDDADIVFDQDDGFSSAIGQLIQSSKRPVILVTSSLSCPHLQKFLQCGKIININPLLPRMLGTWLDLMCLADSGTCFPGLGAKFLDHFKGDMRKTINCLQFHMTVHSKDSLQDENTFLNSKSTSDDEGSNMSWPDSEGIEVKNMMKSSVKEDIWKHFMNKQTSLNYLEYPENLFNVWWNIPNLLNATFNTQPQLEAVEIKQKQENNINQNVQELEVLANLINSFSISEYLSSSKPDTCSNIASQPWYSSETDSVSELEDKHEYNKSHEVTKNILNDLVTTSVCETQRMLSCETHTTIQFPSMTIQRERDRTVRRHDYLTDILNPSTALDRRALAVDYWSSCRSICRIEKNRNDIGSKRNNRFCHYLKSMNAAARNETFDILGDSLTCKGKE